MIVEERKNKMEMPLFFFCIFNVFHPGVAGIIAPVGGPGSDVITYQRLVTIYKLSIFRQLGSPYCT